MSPLCITGGRVLVDDHFAECDLVLDGKVIGSIGQATATGREIDARGLLVLPGIVDIHGDAFERQLQPRPGIDFPVALALAETERQLLANGITTAFHGITLSWEPGLRSAETWRAVLDALGARRWDCDMRVHMRWEAYNLAALDMALADIAAGRVHLLAFNDHTPSIVRAMDDPAKAIKFSGRGPMSSGEFTALAMRVAGRGSEIPAARDRIAEAARAAGIPLASHDDDTVAARTEFRSLGARICEFPMAEEVGIAAREAGDWVVMGSPNVVRGRSHLGWASAARLAEAGICNVLASDYYYPCMAHAPFILARRGTLDLAAAWKMVAGNPAAAAGLSDRGRLVPGMRADIVLVDPGEGHPSVVATIASGQIAYDSGTRPNRR